MGFKSTYSKHLLKRLLWKILGLSLVSLTCFQKISFYLYVFPLIRFWPPALTKAIAIVVYYLLVLTFKSSIYHCSHLNINCFNLGRYLPTNVFPQLISLNGDWQSKPYTIIWVQHSPSSPFSGRKRGSISLTPCGTFCPPTTRSNYYGSSPNTPIWSGHLPRWVSHGSPFYSWSTFSGISNTK